MRAALVLAQVKVRPDLDAGPGGDVIQTITNWIAGITLVGCLIALIVGAAMWALGSNANNYNQVHGGKRTVMVAALAALIIGGAAAIINAFYGLGGEI